MRAVGAAGAFAPEILAAGIGGAAGAGAAAVGAARTIVNLGGEGEVPGVINQNTAWILDPAFGSAQAGATWEASATLSELQAAGNQFVVSSNEALPFANGSIDEIITNSVPIGGSSIQGAGISAIEVWRVLAPGGVWINNGVIVPRP